MVSLIAAIFVLGILIIVHELGHFLLAKANGIGVEKFSIGFGPRVWGKKVDETEYLVAAIPLGGYVKMFGDNPDEEAGAAAIAPEKSFTAKPVLARLSVVAAGPVANLLLAVVIFWAVFMIGVPVLMPVVGDVQKDFPAMTAGLAKGDRITAIDGRPIRDWDEMTVVIHDNPGRALAVSVRRGGEALELTVTPRKTTVKNIFGEDTSVGLIGISPAGETIPRRYGPFESIGMAFERTWEIISLTFIGLAKIFQRVVPADSIGGPIMIVQMAGETARLGVMNLIFLVAFLSVNLGIFNLLPIPILDGGHILFFLIEAVRGKPVSVRKREIVQQIGLAILISIFVFASYNDIMRLAARFFGK
jgi:regulator of sigma E protease